MRRRTCRTAFGCDCAEAGGHDYFAALARRAGPLPAMFDSAVALARELGAELPAPGVGRTRDRWSALASLGAIDLTVARVAEPHLDALAILAEAGHPDLGDDALARSLGRVRRRGRQRAAACAAAADPERRDAAAAAERLADLDGDKPWCSLAEVVDHALVTAWIDEDQRGLFAVSLRQPGSPSRLSRGPGSPTA